MTCRTPSLWSPKRRTYPRGHAKQRVVLRESVECIKHFNDNQHSQAQGAGLKENAPAEKTLMNTSQVRKSKPATRNAVSTGCVLSRTSIVMVVLALRRLYCMNSYLRLSKSKVRARLVHWHAVDREWIEVFPCGAPAPGHELRESEQRVLF